MNYTIYKIIHFNPFKEVKYFFQRGIRGWCDRDLWSIDYYLCYIIPPMLRKYNKIRSGYPHFLTDKQWGKIIKTMADGFEAMKIIDNEFPSDKEEKELEKKFNEGMKLFVKYFRHLWD